MPYLKHDLFFVFVPTLVILKDVTYTVMSELLQFMYEGKVNVKHTDLGCFMKIAQALQIKGLTTSMQRPSAAHSPALHQSPSSKGSASGGGGGGGDSNFGNVIESKINSALYAAKAAAAASEAGSSVGAVKRPLDYGASTSGTAADNPLSIHRKKSIRRSSDGGSSALTGATGGDHDLHESMENMSSDEVFMPPIPQISMADSSRFDLNNVKRETSESMLSPGSVMRLVPQPFNFEYNPGMFGGNGGNGGNGGGGSGSGGGVGAAGGPKSNVEYPNELHMSNDYIGKGGSGNHMDIPSGKSLCLLFFVHSACHFFMLHPIFGSNLS